MTFRTRFVTVVTWKLYEGYVFVDVAVSLVFLMAGRGKELYKKFTLTRVNACNTKTDTVYCHNVMECDSRRGLKW
jgi:hypothetical protein